MASLVEIHDVLQNICRQYEVEDILTWANRVCPAHHERGPPLPLKPILCLEHAACIGEFYMEFEGILFGQQYEEGQGNVGKALKYNQPFYVPDISESREDVCPYLSVDSWRKDHFLGALAIKLSSTACTSCGNYVVEFLFKRRKVTSETQKRLVHRIIDHLKDALKDATVRFVTYGKQGPLFDLAEDDIAVSETTLVRSNPPYQSISDFNLNLTNQTVGNIRDGQLPMQQLRYTGVLDAMPTRGNLLAQSTDVVVNPRDGNVLQWPHEQGPIQLLASATSNIEASRENIVPPTIGEFQFDWKNIL
ncbi:hypothetical protein SLA2020_091410 [Shorea laevis]